MQLYVDEPNLSKIYKKRPSWVMCWSDPPGYQGGAGLPSVIDAKKDSDQAAPWSDAKFFASRAIRKYYINRFQQMIFIYIFSVEWVLSFIRLSLIIKQLHSTISINL